MAKNTIPSEVITRVKAEHPGQDLELLENDHAQVIARPATAREYQRFLDELSDPETRGRASRALVINCIVYPESDEFLRMLEKTPGLISAFTNPVLELSGFKAVTDRKKL